MSLLLNQVNFNITFLLHLNPYDLTSFHSQNYLPYYFKDNVQSTRWKAFNISYLNYDMLACVFTSMIFASVIIKDDISYILMSIQESELTNHSFACISMFL